MRFSTTAGRGSLPTMESSVKKIVSGGQTGADRGGLEAALELSVPHGGWCPKGRRSEDGVIPSCFELEETPVEVYAVRTRWNVRDSDVTVIFTRGPLTGGSALTMDMAVAMKRPVLHVDLTAMNEDHAVDAVACWLNELGPEILNVAGTRESQAPGLADQVKRLLLRVLSR